MPACYSVYGLRLRSNLPIPGLLRSESGSEPDVCVSLGASDAWPPSHRLAPEAPWSTSSTTDAGGAPTLVVWRAADASHYRFCYSDGTEFWLDGSGTRICARWPDVFTVEDATVYLLGPILGFVLHLHGVTCLHASAVAIGERAIALVGPGGVGKSTTAAAFARLGYPVLADDVVALCERGDALMVPPAHSYLKVWPESGQLLLGSSEALPRLTPTWDKRYIDLSDRAYRFQNEPLPLAGIYFLGARSVEIAAPRIEPVTGRAGLMSLVANSYVARHLDTPARARELRVLGRVAAVVPLRHVTPPGDAAALAGTCDAIVRDFRQAHSAHEAA